MLLQMVLFIICHIFFVHSSVSGHLGCFHVFAIVYSATLNSEVHIFFQIMVYSRYWPRIGIAGSCGNYFFVCLFVLAVPKACGSSQDRDQTHATAATLGPEVTIQVLNPLSKQGTPTSRFSFLRKLHTGCTNLHSH